jgi:C4-dicarboxylate-specific signal transduction histidine kinase
MSEKEDKKTAPPAKGKINILIVDDLPKNLLALETVLSDPSYHVVRAGSGPEALRCLLDEDFAMILLDVNMPVMDGFETAQVIRGHDRFRHIPIIFITGVEKADIQIFKGYSIGAVDYILQPLVPEILKAKVAVFAELFKKNSKLELRAEKIGKINEELNAVNAELQETKLELEVETAERIRTLEELRQKDVLIHQSRMTAMGEMLGNIAHQWRQPLNVLGLQVQELGLSYRHGSFTKELLDDSIANAMRIIQHLSQTIDTFRDFLISSNEKTPFKVDQIIAKAVSLVEENYSSLGIQIEIGSAGDPQVVGHENEFGQVLLNLLRNAKDALLERRVDDARITVRSWAENDRAVVTVTDNAGGITEEILDKIFDAYFTTKDLGKGTGVGLFISKNIIENNLGGRLSVHNVEGGAEFRIEV